MKKYLHAFSMTQSMFCALPWPFAIWDEDARGDMLLFLPVVGLEIGAIWTLGWYLSMYFGLDPLIRGLILCVIPFLATGFIHLDGYMDVTDAVGSCRDLEKRRAILKDSHVGAFAVIGCVILMIAQFAFGACVEEKGQALLLIPVVSRCCSALAVTVLPPMSTSQYAGRTVNKGHIAALSVMLTTSLAAGFFLWGKGALCLVGTLIGYGFALHKGYQSLEGMNGDISGYALTLGELAGLVTLALLQEVI